MGADDSATVRSRRGVPVMMISDISLVGAALLPVVSAGFCWATASCMPSVRTEAAPSIRKIFMDDLPGIMIKALSTPAIRAAARAFVSVRKIGFGRLDLLLQISNSRCFTPRGILGVRREFYNVHGRPPHLTPAVGHADQQQVNEDTAADYRQQAENFRARSQRNQHQHAGNAH